MTSYCNPLQCLFVKQKKAVGEGKNYLPKIKWSILSPGFAEFQFRSITDLKTITHCIKNWHLSIKSFQQPFTHLKGMLYYSRIRRKNPEVTPESLGWLHPRWRFIIQENQLVERRKRVQRTQESCACSQVYNIPIGELRFWLCHVSGGLSYFYN